MDTPEKEPEVPLVEAQEEQEGQPPQVVVTLKETAPGSYGTHVICPTDLLLTMRMLARAQEAIACKMGQVLNGKEEEVEEPSRIYVPPRFARGN